MEVYLLVRCFLLLIALSLFALGATVSQSKDVTRLVAEDSVKSSHADGVRSRVVLSSARVNVTDKAGDANLANDQNNALRHGEGAVHGQINGRGVFVSDAKATVIQAEGTPPTPDRSSSAEKDVAIKIQQQPGFFQREHDHGGDGILDTDAEDDAWNDLPPVSLTEEVASTVSDMDEAHVWWDRRRRRRRYDCRWTQWQGWTTCTVECGAGEKQRDRHTDGPHWGGKICQGPKSEYETCGLKDCPVGCEWNHWGAWGPCSKTCGSTGLRVRQRGILPFTNEANDEGPQCSVSQQTKSGECNRFACPVNCGLLAWATFGHCSKTCGTGIKSRVRDHNNQLYGGERCHGEYTMDEPCNSFVCPVDCVWNAWGGWGTCTRTCGGGYKLRERLYSSQAQNGGQACPGSPAELLACNIEDCAVDCLWQEWHDPGPCTKTCGGGVFQRHRSKVKEVLAGGAECTGPNTEIGPCNVEPCPRDCVFNEWDQFGECSTSCGGGIHATTRTYKEAEHGGVGCNDANTTKEEECNAQSCPTIMVKGGAKQHSMVMLPVTFSLFLLRRDA